MGSLPDERRWRVEVLDPATMSDHDLRDELAHDLNAYNQAQHQLSKAAMARRIEELVSELDRRAA